MYDYMNVILIGAFMRLPPFQDRQTRKIYYLKQPNKKEF